LRFNIVFGGAMARLARVALVGVPQHIIQRGNNRQACFAGEEDMKAYLHWVKELSMRHQIDVHAWVLMTNHVHLLCTPWKENAVSQMMQSIGRLYVRYFNRTYRRSGTLWEGRFKSCLVQSDCYLLELYRYIELNPVRANMVDEPSDYSWSSYAINALGVESELQTPHPEYLALGTTKEERLRNYRELFKACVGVNWHPSFVGLHFLKIRSIIIGVEIRLHTRCADCSAVLD
jgi:putative transposase